MDGLTPKQKAGTSIKDLKISQEELNKILKSNEWWIIIFLMVLGDWFKNPDENGEKDNL